MPFEKEPRYWVRRSIGIRFAYLNCMGTETISPVGYGEQWSNGGPRLFTHRQAIRARDAANLNVDRDARYEVKLAEGSYNS
jgi:hypothetical protein